MKEKTLVLLRHGESVWNRENLFTGWTDVALSDRGRGEAREAGRLLREEAFDICFTSRLKRAIHTLDIALDAMDGVWLPVVKDWRLNERHYGALQGLNKAETAEKYGEAQVKVWRRSFDVRPPALPEGDERGPDLQRGVRGYPAGKTAARGEPERHDRAGWCPASRSASDRSWKRGSGCWSRRTAIPCARSSCISKNCRKGRSWNSIFPRASRSFTAWRADFSVAEKKFLGDPRQNRRPGGGSGRAGKGEGLNGSPTF